MFKSVQRLTRMTDSLRSGGEWHIIVMAKQAASLPAHCVFYQMSFHNLEVQEAERNLVLSIVFSSSNVPRSLHIEGSCFIRFVTDQRRRKSVVFVSKIFFVIFGFK